jgi:predicted nucleic acid-binding protein
MPTSGDRPQLLCDTSIAVALCVADHAHHASAVRAIRGHELGLAGHAAFETFSVLTRLPAPARRPAGTVTRLLAATFPHSRFLPPRDAARLLDELGAGEIAGGAVYDALVGATARAHKLPLATRDRRALDTYRVLGVDVRVVAD